jgi:hypothetical protein
LKSHANALILGAESASALASSTSFLTLSTRRSLSPRATKSRKRRMICPARKACSAALSMAWRSNAERSSVLFSSNRREPFM